MKDVEGVRQQLKQAHTFHLKAMQQNSEEFQTILDQQAASHAAVVLEAAEREATIKASFEAAQAQLTISADKVAALEQRLQQSVEAVAAADGKVKTAATEATTNSVDQIEALQQELSTLTEDSITSAHELSAQQKRCTEAQAEAQAAIVRAAAVEKQLAEAVGVHQTECALAVSRLADAALTHAAAEEVLRKELGEVALQGEAAAEEANAKLEVERKARAEAEDAVRLTQKELTGTLAQVHCLLTLLLSPPLLAAHCCSALACLCSLWLCSHSRCCCAAVGPALCVCLSCSRCCCAAVGAHL